MKNTLTKADLSGSAQAFNWGQVAAYISSARVDTEFGDELSFDCERIIALKKLEASKNSQEQLEGVLVEINKTLQLFGFLGDYFCKVNPDLDELLLRRKEHCHLYRVTLDRLFAHVNSLNEITRGLKCGCGESE